MFNRKVNLACALDYLELILGQDWLEKNLKVMKDSHCGRGGFGRNIDFSALGIAYVAKIWYKAREEAINLEIVGSGLPGPYSLTAAALAEDLKVLKGCAGLHIKIDELKDVKLSLKTAHELGIASGYTQNGHGVDFTYSKASDWPNLQVCKDLQCRTSAFIVRNRANQTINICAEVDMLEDFENIFTGEKYHRSDQGAQSAIRRCSSLCVQCACVVSTDRDERPYQRVLYLYVGDILTEAEPLMHKWLNHPEITRLVRNYDEPVIIYATGIKYINNQPAYFRCGRLVKDNQTPLTKDIYLPDEITTLLL